MFWVEEIAFLMSGFFLTMAFPGIAIAQIAFIFS